VAKVTVPTADYKKLEGYLSQLFDFSFANAKEKDTFFKDLFSENQGLSHQSIDFLLGQADKHAAWQDDDRKLWEDTYRPLMQQQALRAQDYASPEMQEYQAGRAMGDVATQFDEARSAAQDRLASFGVDPSQMRAGALDTQSRIAEGAALASAGNQARFRTEQYGDQLMANAVAAGQNLPQQALQGGQAAASNVNQGVNTGLATTASAASTMGTPYQWASAGAQDVGLWGQLVNAQFQNQLSAEQSNRSDSSGIGSFLGAASSIASMFLDEGGAIPDDQQALPPPAPDQTQGEPGRYLPPGMSPSNGAIPDDIDAQIADSGRPAKLNAGEFVVPKDVTAWLGEKGLQQIILKARKEMGNEQQRPAQPEVAGQQQQPPPIPPRGVGAIPELEGV
jgi:hypothetical protein